MKVTANGMRLNVEERGAGEPALVFLHYWGGSSRTWRHVTAALADRHRTVSIDHRGWGGSDPADAGVPGEGYAIADLADDASAVIRALGLRRHVLVGHSMGGKVAQLLASRRSPGLAGLVLVASAPPTPLALPERAREMMAGAYDTRASVEATIDEVLTARPLDPADREQVIADSLRGAPAAKTAWPASSSREDISDAIDAIRVPTLVVAGELDRIETLDSVENGLIRHFPHADLHVLAGTGHLSPLEAPDDLTLLVGRFAAGLA